MNNNRGVISLEALMIIPFFLTLIIGLLFLIRIAFIQIALQNATDEAVKQMAAIMYPLEPSIQEAVSMKDDWLNSFLSYVPESIGSSVETLLTNQLNESLTEPAMKQLFKPIFWHYVNSSYRDSLIHYERLSIEKVTIPYLNNDDSLFGIEVSYKFRLSLPFYQRTILIRKRAYERVWFGS